MKPERKAVLDDAFKERARMYAERRSLDEITKDWHARTAGVFDEMAAECMRAFPRPGDRQL